ncbi:MAG: slipin family protein [Deltaproteobacteria bacterium]|nr:slipin family protein [Deltaproteobacteria bacterium]MBI2342110.1 slipin family protein [Deltaproteobacteria bacterium]MBI2974887.1 slipin family protein [Deltaproteobacteria bacterium]
MINLIVFVVLLAVGEFISAGIYKSSPAAGAFAGAIAFFAALLISLAIKLANQWERVIILRLGKFFAVKGPGLFFIIPVVDQTMKVDTRILTLEIPKQQVITKDNVPVSINGVVYFRVERAEEALIKVQNFAYAMSQYAQATLRDVIGGMTLDQLLAEREQIGKEIEEIVERESSSWGLKVIAIKIMDIDMPEDLKKMMSRQASAEREKRATITKAEGDKMAAFNLSAAAETMAKSPGAMQLRTLQTIDGLGPSASNTVVLAVPIEIMETVRKYIGQTAAKVSTPSQ